MSGEILEWLFQETLCLFFNRMIRFFGEKPVRSVILVSRATCAPITGSSPISPSTTNSGADVLDEIIVESS